MRFFSKIVLFLVSVSFAYADEEDSCSHWGYHLIMDCRACEISRITDRDTLTQFVKTLVKEIDMKAFGEPMIEHFAEHNPEAAGYSLMQFIETSSITGHFVDKNGDAYIDIFSCKTIDVEKAKAVVQLYLQPKKIRVTFLHRQA